MGIDLGSLIEGTAYGALTELLGEMRSGDDGAGVTLTSRYEVMIHPPSGYRGDNNGADSKNVMGLQMGEKIGNGDVTGAALRCSQISFPGRTIETTADTNHGGPIRNIATGYSYGQITANFQCSPDMREKRLFETWQRLTYNPQTWAMQYYNNYVGALDIFSLNRKDKRKYGVQLVECFPTAIADQSLDAAPGQLQLIGVTFNYRYWKNLTDEADLPKPLQERITDLFKNNVQRQITANLPKVLHKLI